jgi:hypothetical protein
MAATMIVSGLRPVREPQSHGSITLDEIASTARNSVSVHSTADQPGATAKARNSGKAAASIVPT